MDNKFKTKSLYDNKEYDIILSDDVIEFLKTFALVTHIHDKSTKWTEVFTINQVYFKRINNE